MQHPDSVMRDLDDKLQQISDPALQREIRMAICSLLVGGGFSGMSDRLVFRTVASAEKAAQIAAGTPYEKILTKLISVTRLIIASVKTMEEMDQLIAEMRSVNKTLNKIYKNRNIDDDDD